MIKKTTIFIAFVTIILSVNPIISQSFNDFSNVNFSELSDGEIDLLLRRATAQGYTQFDLLKMAKAQGFTQADIENLDKRFKSAQTIARIAESATTPLEETRLRKQWLQNLEVFRETESDVFGYNVFRGTSFLSFYQHQMIILLAQEISYLLIYMVNLKHIIRQRYPRKDMQYLKILALLMSMD